MTTYKEIFDLTLRNIDDPALAQWPEYDLSNELYSWMLSAIAGLPKLQSQFSERSTFDVDEIETTGFTNTLSDTAKKILALSMTREWLRPQINSTALTLQRYSKREGYSQKEFLSGLMSLDDKLNTELKKLLRDDSYVNSEYFEG